MENQVNLDSSKYEELLRCLFILKDVCTDVDIRGGYIRQKTNDGSTVFEIDLTSIVSNLSIPIDKVKTKLDYLKWFSNGQEISIKTIDKYFYILNQVNEWEIQKVDLEYLDNKFISQEEFSRTIITDPEDLIISTQISKYVSDGIRIFSNSNNVNSLQTIFTGSVACICSRDQSKTNFAKFLSDIPSNRELNSSTNLVIIPFIIDHDGDMNFSMYDVGNYIVNVFSTTVGSIGINLYTRAKMIENKE